MNQKHTLTVVFLLMLLALTGLMWLQRYQPRLFDTARG